MKVLHYIEYIFTGVVGTEVLNYTGLTVKDPLWWFAIVAMWLTAGMVFLKEDLVNYG